MKSIRSRSSHRGHSLFGPSSAIALHRDEKRVQAARAGLLTKGASAPSTPPPAFNGVKNSELVPFNRA